MVKVAVTISGGWDSMAAYYGAASYVNGGRRAMQPVFFSYGQIYEAKERACAEAFCEREGLGSLFIYEMPGYTDMPFRNFFFLLILRANGFREVVMGNRNLVPWFDKYKDSNWLSLKIFAWLINVKLHLPVTGWPKWGVVRWVRGRYSGEVYNCYFNNSDLSTCDCVNCREMRAL